MPNYQYRKPNPDEINCVEPAHIIKLRKEENLLKRSKLLTLLKTSNRESSAAWKIVPYI